MTKSTQRSVGWQKIRAGGQDKIRPSKSERQWSDRPQICRILYNPSYSCPSCVRQLLKSPIINWVEVSERVVVEDQLWRWTEGSNFLGGIFSGRILEGLLHLNTITGKGIMNEGFPQKKRTTTFCGKETESGSSTASLKLNFLTTFWVGEWNFSWRLMHSISCSNL